MSNGTDGRVVLAIEKEREVKLPLRDIPKDADVLFRSKEKPTGVRELGFGYFLREVSKNRGKTGCILSPIHKCSLQSMRG